MAAYSNVVENIEVRKDHNGNKYEVIKRFIDNELIEIIERYYDEENYMIYEYKNQRPTDLLVKEYYKRLNEEPAPEIKTINKQKNIKLNKKLEKNRKRIY